MKSLNKYLNILNLVEIIIVAVLPFNLLGFIHIYPTYRYLIKIISYCIEAINIICGIINIKRKQKTIGILSITIGILSIAILLIRNTNLQYELPDETIVITTLIVDTTIVIISIVNLIINRKVQESEKRKLPLIVFVTLIVINIVIITKVSIEHTKNAKRLKEALDSIQNDENMETYIIDKDDKFIFIDRNGNEITTKDYEEIYSGFNKYKINNNINYLTFARKEKNAVIINSIGEEIFSLKLGKADEMYYEKLSKFIKYVERKEKYEIKKERTEEQILIPQYKYLERYEENNKKFEDNLNYEYIYFRNSQNQNNILQVVITGEKENDNKLAKNYDEFNNTHKAYNRDIEQISEFYKKKKEYYLINFNENTKKKLECNNLIYEANYGENELIEKIIIFENGNIPFCDETESGYFDKTGKKVNIGSSYLVYSANDKYIMLMGKSEENTIVLSNETGKIEKQLKNVLIEYNGFYISYPNSNNAEYAVLDKKLNTVVTTDEEPKLIGNSILKVTSNNKEYIYIYNEDNIKLIYESEEFGYIRVIVEYEDTFQYSKDIYSNIGIIK